MAITHGTATYTQRRRLGEYEHHEASIVLHFNVEDDGAYAPILHQVTHEAKTRALQMLLHMPSTSDASWDKAVDKVAAHEDPEIVSLPKPKRGRKPKTPAPALDELPDPEFDGPASGEADTIDDVIDEDDDEETVGQEPGPSVDEVVKAVTEKNKLVKDPPRLKAFIKKWAPASREIPADKRAEFLEALKKFK